MSHEDVLNNKTGTNVLLNNKKRKVNKLCVALDCMTAHFRFLKGFFLFSDRDVSQGHLA